MVLMRSSVRQLAAIAFAVAFLVASVLSTAHASVQFGMKTTGIAPVAAVLQQGEVFGDDHVHEHAGPSCATDASYSCIGHDGNKDESGCQDNCCSSACAMVAITIELIQAFEYFGGAKWPQANVWLSLGRTSSDFRPPRI